MTFFIHTTSELRAKQDALMTKLVERINATGYDDVTWKMQCELAALLKRSVAEHKRVHPEFDPAMLMVDALISQLDADEKLINEKEHQDAT
jgi:hypothetical protein